MIRSTCGMDFHVLYKNRPCLAGTQTLEVYTVILYIYVCKYAHLPTGTNTRIQTFTTFDIRTHIWTSPILYGHMCIYYVCFLSEWPIKPLFLPISLNECRFKTLPLSSLLLKSLFEKSLLSIKVNKQLLC